MKPEEFSLSLSFPQTAEEGPAVRLSFCWRLRTLLRFDLSASEFTWALSTQQFRKAFKIDLNIPLLKDLLTELYDEPITLVSISDTSTRKFKRFHIGLQSESGLVESRNVTEVTQEDWDGLKAAYPEAIFKCCETVRRQFEQHDH